MPQVTVYIRKEDLSLWEAVDKKSQFMHEALNIRISMSTMDKESLNKLKPIEEDRLSELLDEQFEQDDKEVIPKIIKTPKEAKKLNKPPLCPHEQPWLLCKHNECNVKGRNMGL